MSSTVKIFGYEFEVRDMLVVFFSYLLIENIFSWLVLPNSIILLLYEKIVGILVFAYVMYNFANLKLGEKIIMGLMSAILLRLIFESMIDYGTIFQQLTLFTILVPVAYVVFIKAVARTLDLDILKFIANFYIFTYVVFMAIYGRGFSFSLATVVMVDYGPFSGDTRVIHARSIFMMIIPMLFYFHQFIQAGKLKFFLPFALCFIVILIHQHRSVWASALFAIGIYLFMALRNKLIPLPKILQLILGGTVILVLATFVISQVFPGMIKFFADRFSEIFDPTREDGTGKFRADQRRVYFPMVLEKPFFGWTFKGFEMENPLVDWWPAKSGQHFHEGYMEMLFYHGIFGLVLKYFYLAYLAVKSFSRKLNQEAVVLIAFSVSGLIFSFSYVLPLVFWGHVGLCLYYLEREPMETEDGVTIDLNAKNENPNTMQSPNHQLSNQKLINSQL